MGENIFEELQPTLMERLGRVYNSDSGYKKAREEKNRIFNRISENFGKEQLQLLEEYLDAVSIANGICEMLAYSQGIRDLAALLGFAK